MDTRRSVLLLFNDRRPDFSIDDDSAGGGLGLLGGGVGGGALSLLKRDLGASGSVSSNSCTENSGNSGTGVTGTSGIGRSNGGGFAAGVWFLSSPEDFRDVTIERGTAFKVLFESVRPCEGSRTWAALSRFASRDLRGCTPLAQLLGAFGAACGTGGTLNTSFRGVDTRPVARCCSSIAAFASNALKSSPVNEISASVTVCASTVLRGGSFAYTTVSGRGAAFLMVVLLPTTEVKDLGAGVAS
jgi:hypothetical protein